MNAQEFIEKNNIKIDKEELASFKKLTGVEPLEALTKILNALQKFNVELQYQIMIAEKPYAWYELYEDPEKEVKDFVKEDGSVDGGAVYNWAITD